MQTTSFGKSGLKVSRLGLGMAALGRPGYITLGHKDDLEEDYSVDRMRQKAIEMLDSAYAMGVRYFDAARSYGRGEEFLGAWIKERKHSDIIIGSKWGYVYTADWQVKAEKHEVKEHSIDVLDHQWEETKHNIGKHLNIYQIHSATLDSKVLGNKEVLERLWELRENGIVIGLSLSGDKQGVTLEKALEIRKNGKLLFGSVQITWNVLEQSNVDVIEKASQEGMGIIVKEAVANGRLTERNKEGEFSEKKKVLLNMARKYDVGIDALAISYVLHQKWANVVLSGATTAEQLNSNKNAFTVNLSEGDMNMLKSFAEPSGEYWAKRSGLEWN